MASKIAEIIEKAGKSLSVLSGKYVKLRDSINKLKDLINELSTDEVKELKSNLSPISGNFTDVEGIVDSIRVNYLNIFTYFMVNGIEDSSYAIKLTSICFKDKDPLETHDNNIYFIKCTRKEKIRKFVTKSLPEIYLCRVIEDRGFLDSLYELQKEAEDFINFYLKFFNLKDKERIENKVADYLKNNLHEKDVRRSIDSLIEKFKDARKTMKYISQDQESCNELLKFMNTLINSKRSYNTFLAKHLNEVIIRYLEGDKSTLEDLCGFCVKHPAIEKAIEKMDKVKNDIEESFNKASSDLESLYKRVNDIAKRLKPKEQKMFSELLPPKILSFENFNRAFEYLEKLDHPLNKILEECLEKNERLALEIVLSVIDLQEGRTELVSVLKKVTEKKLVKAFIKLCEKKVLNCIVSL